jgi:hypothetical protein
VDVDMDVMVCLESNNTLSPRSLFNDFINAVADVINNQRPDLGFDTCLESPVQCREDRGCLKPGTLFSIHAQQQRQDKVASCIITNMNELRRR